MILVIRTDKPEAELYLYTADTVVDYKKWFAHRELSNTLLSEIEGLLRQHKLTRYDLNGVVVFQGPGSFTGLRIGITVANTLAYSLGIPVVASKGEHWIITGLTEVVNHSGYTTGVTPLYGQAAHITQPKK